MHAHWDCSRGLSVASVLASCIGAANSNSQSEDWVVSLEGLLPNVFDGLVERCSLKLQQRGPKSGFLIQEICLNESQPLSFERIDGQLERSDDLPGKVAECARAVLKELCSGSETQGDSVLGSDVVKDIVLAVGVLSCLDRLSVRSVSCGPIPILIGDFATKLPALSGLPIQALESTSPYIATAAMILFKVLIDRFNGAHAKVGCSPPVMLHKLVTGRADIPVEHETTVALGESHIPQSSCNFWNTDEMCVMETNIDDCTSEHLSFCVDLLLQEGAADAWVAPIVMKKGRAAHTLHCLCRVKQKESLLKVLFRNSTTLGVRVLDMERIALRRKMLTVQTKWKENELEGRVNVKVGYLGRDVVSLKAEFDHCRTISLSIKEPISVIADAAVQLARMQLQD